jgi:hypothetical protein
MNYICPQYRTCNNGGCYHQREHEPHLGCNVVCRNDSTDGCICVDSIKIIRKEKLEKIENESSLYK